MRHANFTRTSWDKNITKVSVCVQHSLVNDPPDFYLMQNILKTYVFLNLFSVYIFLIIFFT